MSNGQTVLAPRQDLLLEGYQSLDGTGNYVSPWFESAGINHARIVANYSALSVPPLVSFTLTEAAFIDTVDDPNRVTLRNQQLSVSGSLVYAEFALTARFFRLAANGGTDNAGAAFFVTMRGL